MCLGGCTRTSKAKINVFWNILSLRWPLCGCSIKKNVDFSLWGKQWICLVKLQIVLVVKSDFTIFLHFFEKFSSPRGRNYFVNLLKFYWGFWWSVEIDPSSIMEVLPHRHIWTPAEGSPHYHQYYHSDYFCYSPQPHQCWSPHPYSSSTWQYSYSNSWNNEVGNIMTNERFHEFFFCEILLSNE